MMKAVDPPEHYRRKAQEALEAAELARKSYELRGVDMARGWFELADFYDKPRTVSYNVFRSAVVRLPRTDATGHRYGSGPLRPLKTRELDGR